MVRERPYRKGKYPGLDWWDAQPDNQWLTEHDRRLIRIGYFERMSDVEKAKYGLAAVVLMGRIKSTGTASTFLVKEQ